ncbi:MAG: rod shape-determining protein MreD [Anaerolineae bacterium]|nr:rod shape-determining protein MreD [Anaerolineae bacterium]MCA9893009.1 rod shape-determining protein MreD [Anaerolineae bacterium]
MGYYISLPVLILAAVLQSSLMGQLRIAGGAPDFVLLIVLLWSIHAPLNEAVFWAFVGGIVTDLMSIIPLGSSVVGMLLMIYLIKRLSVQLFRINIVLVAGFVLLGTVIQISVTHLILAFTGFGLLPGDIFQYVIIPELFYHLVLFLPIYLVMRGVQQRIYPEPGTRL